MVLLPCSTCCPTCSCPDCTCCQCKDWDSFFDVYRTYPDGLGPNEDAYLLQEGESLYDALEAIGVCDLTRPFESQQDCVDAVLAAFAAQREAYCQSECGNDQACYDQCIIDYGEYPGDPASDGDECGEIYVIGSDGYFGWSRPLVGGEPATPALLDDLCPAGSPPPNTDLAEGEVAYWGTGQYTGAGTPDIHKLVFKTGSSTGDPIADALFVRGTRNDLPALPWQEADDCGSCDNPPAYEYDCDPATDDKRFYAKTVDWEFTHPSENNLQDPACPLTVSDPLGLCPPQNCKQVTITVTRTDKCDSEDVVTEWRAIVYVCPCLLVPIIGVDSETGDLWESAYGYDSEADCIADWDNANCIGNQWQQVRHEIYNGDRELMPQGCCDSGGIGGTC